MINALLNGIITLIRGLVSAILGPINTIVMTAFPAFRTILSYIGGFFTMVSNGVVWFLSWLPIPNDVRAFIVLFFGFILVVPYLVHFIKLFLKWWDTLKL